MNTSKVLFASASFFHLAKYTTSHRTMVLTGFDAEADRSIDLMFYGLFYAEVITKFDGITIRVPEDEVLLRLEEKCRSGYPYLADVYFAIETQGKTFYVGASQLSIEPETA